MADEWDQFPDASQAQGDDPWAQFPDAQNEQASPSRDERIAELKLNNPGEYDSESPEYRQKYGQAGFGQAMKSVGGAALRSPVVAGDALLNVGRQVVAAPVAGVAGLVTAPAGFIPGMEGVGARNVERVQQFIGGQPFTDGGEAVTGAIAYPFEKLAQGADFVGQKTSDVTGSPAVGAAVNTAIQAAPAVFARGRIGRGNRGPNPSGNSPELGKTTPPAKTASEAQRPARLDRVSEAAPSIDELQAAKNAAYKAAEETGVVVSRQGMNRLKVSIVNDLKKEGLDRDLHPAATAALKRIVETKGQPTLTELETLRKIGNDAKTSNNPADARLGGRIVSKIDDFEEGLTQADIISGNPAAATAFKEARALNQRVAKARTIQKIFDDAEVIAGANYTVSGMENALRQQFKALAKNEKKLRGFTPEERAAIKKVALGGRTENAMRLLGKFAPNGVVSSLAGISAYGLAGPTGLALPAAGLIGKHLSTRMTMRNATRASDLVRRGQQSQAAIRTKSLEKAANGRTSVTSKD